MLIGVFKSNQRILSIVAVVLFAVLWSGLTLLGLSNELTSSFAFGIKWLDVFIGILLVSFQAIFLNYVVNESKLVNANTNLPSLMIVIVSSASIFIQEFNQILLANTLILLVFHQLLNLYNVNNKLSILFNTGLLVGISSLIYMPSLVFLPFIWLVLIYMTTPVWRDFAISLIGWALPIIYFVSYYYVVKDLEDLVLIQSEVRLFDKELGSYLFWNKVFFVLLIGFISMGVFSLLKTSSRGTVRVRKMIVVVILWLGVAGTSIFLNKGDVVATILVAVVPLSIVLASMFQTIKRVWIAETLFVCLVAVILLGYFS
jgi:hypothetical protein